MYDDETARRLADPHAMARIRAGIDRGMALRPRRRRLTASILGVAAALFVAGSGAAAYAAYNGSFEPQGIGPTAETPQSTAEPSAIGERKSAWDLHIAQVRAKTFFEADGVGSQVRWLAIGSTSDKHGIKVWVAALTPDITAAEVASALEDAAGMPVTVIMEAYGDTSHEFVTLPLPAGGSAESTWPSPSPTPSP